MKLAFWLWNKAQVVLSALEASLINNTMLIQIAVLAVLFLGERLTAPQVAGLALAGGGVLFVQLARMRAANWTRGANAGISKRSLGGETR